MAQPQPGGPAAKAGITAGDVITAVNGNTVADPRDLAKKIAAVEAGEDVELTVWRDGKAKAVDVAIKAMPGDDEGRPPHHRMQSRLRSKTLD